MGPRDPGGRAGGPADPQRAEGRVHRWHDLHLLDRYRARQAADQAQTIAASDGLPALFMISDPLVSLGRDLALSGMDLLPVLRRQFVHQAAGMAALEVQHG